MHPGPAPTISPRTAALVAGLALVGCVLTAPFAELYALPKLVVPFKATETAHNILAHRGLFVAVIFAYFIASFCDLLLSWALYLFFRPVNEALSLLTAWCRLVYTVITLVALNNLVIALRLLVTPEYLAMLGPAALHGQVLVLLRSFRYEWYFGMLFFAIHLLFLSYLAYQSGYVPKIVAVLVGIAGLGYLLSSAQPYLLPEVDTGFLQVTYVGELVFMVWLLVRGGKARPVPKTT